MHDNVTSFGDLVPPDVATADADDADRAAPLAPSEEAAVARAVPKRRDEFRSGRAAARRALDSLGVVPGPIPMGPDRGPVWPDDVVGAITHCDGLCAAAVARSVDYIGLGIDAEVVGNMTAEVLGVVTSPQERAMLSALPAEVAEFGGVALFSAKESIHKAIHPRTGVMLDFTDVELILGPGGELTIGRLTPTATDAFAELGAFDRADVSLVARHRPPHVLTVVAVRPMPDRTAG